MKLSRALNKHNWYTKNVVYLIYYFYLCTREINN